MHAAQLLHLADSGLPTGAFAYSSGLESSLTLGLIRDDSGLRHHLYAGLQQAGGFELPFLASCASLAPGDELREIVEIYDAQLLVPAVARASVVQGRTWLKLLRSFYPDADLDVLGDWFAAHDLPTHFTPMVALTLHRVGCSLSEMQTLMLHLLLRDQLSAAIRLGFLGPLEAHRLQHAFYDVFDPIIAAQTGKTHRDAARSAFVLDIAQLLHGDLYTRLFQT